MDRQCTKCGAIKPLEDYHLSKTGKYGHRAICKVCYRLHYRRSRKVYGKPYIEALPLKATLQADRIEAYRRELNRNRGK